MTFRRMLLAGVLMGCATSVVAAEDLRDAVLFHVPFDSTFDAQVGVDVKPKTADTHARAKVVEGNQRNDIVLLPDGGKFGGAIRFQSNAPEVLMYSGRNLGFRRQDWSGAVSFWLRLDPDKDLKPGFSDPLLITEKKWNDAAFFIDFDDQQPRTLRLGTFSDYRSWNPDDTPFEKIPQRSRPMLPVEKPPFSRDRWTHVAFTFENVNPTDGKTSVARLYLNGKLAGEHQRELRYTWEPERVAIMLGIQFIGDFDELTIFRRPLTADEIQSLFNAKQGLFPRGSSD